MIDQDQLIIIDQVFKIIKQQTDYRFIYPRNLFKDAPKVHLEKGEILVSKLLEKSLSKEGFNFELSEKNTIIIKENPILASPNPLENVKEQGIQVSGTVSDSSGQPLPGANILEKGTRNGAQSDFDGHFSITVLDKNSILAISYVGFLTQEVTIGNQTSIEITLAENANALDDVVVVGYGTQKKVTITGAIESIKGEDIKATPVSSVTNTLVGRLPGLIAKNTSGEPGYDDSSLLIRGNNTLGDNSPLVVIDGIADRAGGFSRIDANDIETFTILKDASAAIYGSRAANGVILITTKRGSTGKTSIDYTFSTGIKMPTILPDMVDAADYAIAINDITRLIDENPVPFYTQEEIQKFRDGSDPLAYPNVNPQKEALKDFSIQKRHYLSISGGTDKIKYHTSLGYQFEDNLYKKSASDYTQYNLRSNIDVQATDNLKLFTNISLRQEDRNSPYAGAGEIWRNIVQGDPRQIITYPNGLRRAVTSGGYNPLTAVDGTTGYQKNKTSIVNVDLGFDLGLSSVIDGLSLKGQLSIDKNNNFYKAFNKSWDLYSINNTTEEYEATTYGPTNASLNENMSQNLGVTANIRLLYNKTFGEKHELGGFVAYEQYENRYDYLRGQRQDYVSKEIDELFAGDSKDQINDGTSSESARQNYFGRLDYGYAEKYLVQFNWRYDGSQNFPKGKRFGFFPGVSIGWRASEEAFWKENLSKIDYFKIRASYGQLGNDKIRYNGTDQHYTYLTNYTFGQNGIFGGGSPEEYTGIVQVQTGNPNVTWEVATMYNLGIDAKMFDSAVSLSVDIFKQERDKILGQAGAVVPLYAGLSLPAENIGSTESKGLEATLGYGKSFKDFKFNVSGNFTYAKSKIIYFNEAEALPEWQKRTGKSIGADWFMFDAIGVYKTQADLDQYPRLGNAGLGDLIFRDVNNDNILDGNDQIRPDKTSTPEIIYGLNINTSYKQFEFNMLWQGAGNVYSYVFYEGGGGGIGTFTQDYFDNRWTPENPNASGPRIYDRERTAVGRQNTYFLQDASYFRLKNVELAYNFPEKICEQIHAKNLRLFFSGYNVLTFTGIKNIDPEANASNQNYAGWFNVQSKVFNIGLNITF